MPDTVIIYASTTGNTQYVAELLHQQFGTARADLADLTTCDLTSLVSYPNLICCVSSWGRSEMQDDWELLASRFAQLGLQGHKAAILGLGDQKNYPAAFADGVGRMARLLSLTGAKLVGRTSTEGYSFTHSLAVDDGRFLGLIIDEDNQHAQTAGRIANWCKQLKREFSRG